MAAAIVEVSRCKPRNEARDTAFRTLHRSDRRSLMAGICGLIAFINVSRNPRFALIHTGWGSVDRLRNVLRRRLRLD
jgi:hypothetical protein